MPSWSWSFKWLSRVTVVKDVSNGWQALNLVLGDLMSIKVWQSFKVWSIISFSKALYLQVLNWIIIPLLWSFIFIENFCWSVSEYLKYYTLFYLLFVNFPVICDYFIKTSLCSINIVYLNCQINHYKYCDPDRVKH